MSTQNQTRITWYLKASKSNINPNNNYSKYDHFDDKYLISPATIEDVIECLTEMEYDIDIYEFINFNDHCAKWCIVFNIDDYKEFKKKNMKTIINFTSNKFVTSSIHLEQNKKHNNDNDDNDNSDDDDDTEWIRIYKREESE